MFVTWLALAWELLRNRQVRVHLPRLYHSRWGRPSLTICWLAWRPIALILVHLRWGNLRLLHLLGGREVCRNYLLFLDFDYRWPFLALLPSLLGVRCGCILRGNLAQISLLVRRPAILSIRLDLVLIFAAFNCELRVIHFSLLLNDYRTLRIVMSYLTDGHC